MTGTVFVCKRMTLTLTYKNEMTFSNTTSVVRVAAQCNIFRLCLISKAYLDFLFRGKRKAHAQQRHSKRSNIFMEPFNRTLKRGETLLLKTAIINSQFWG